MGIWEGGIRYRDNLNRGGSSAGFQSTTGQGNKLNIKFEGFDELQAAFKDIADYAKKERLIKSAQKRSAKVFKRAVETSALAYTHNKGLSKSFKWKRAKGGGAWIDSVYGADHKSGTDRLTYAGMAGIFAGGTEHRRTKSGKYTGRIEATDFIGKAWDRMWRIVQRLYIKEMSATMSRAVKRAGIDPTLYKNAA